MSPEVQPFPMYVLTVLVWMEPMHARIVIFWYAGLVSEGLRCIRGLCSRWDGDKRVVSIGVGGASCLVINTCVWVVMTSSCC
jgi:hypothetical protein